MPRPLTILQPIKLLSTSPPATLSLATCGPIRRPLHLPRPLWDMALLGGRAASLPGLHVLFGSQAPPSRRLTICCIVRSQRSETTRPAWHCQKRSASRPPTSSMQGVTLEDPSGAGKRRALI